MGKRLGKGKAQQLKRRRTKRQQNENGIYLGKVEKIVVGSALAAGVFLVVRHYYNKYQTSKHEKHSMEEGNPATYASLFKMAFENDMPFGMGTNEEKVFEVLRDIPSKTMYGKVQQAYKDLYKTHLNSDLKDELSTDEFSKALKMLANKKEK
jgi:hypothetical protein